jgi:hypothetical protein
MRDVNPKVFPIDGQEGKLFTKLTEGQWRVAVSPPTGEDYVFFKTVLSSEEEWSEFRRRAEAGEFEDKFPGLQFYIALEESHDIVVAIPQVMRDGMWTSMIYVCLHM